jgi:excisionase family DNA binding protein
MALDNNRYDAALLDVRAVAQTLSLGRSKVYALVASGHLPSVRIGRLVRVPRKELDCWIDARLRVSKAINNAHEDQRKQRRGSS